MPVSVVHTCLKCRATVDPLIAITFKTNKGLTKWYMHNTCKLDCSKCHKEVETDRCFVFNDSTKVYCKNCYYVADNEHCYLRNYEICIICYQNIHETDFAVNLSGKYIHAHCMLCSICSTPLGTGQNVRLDLEGKKIFCEDNTKHQIIEESQNMEKSMEESFPKPKIPYSCMIALSLKNSFAGRMCLLEIYNFICFHFPYFRNDPFNWRNLIRHNLSTNLSFKKMEKSSSDGRRTKGSLWTIEPNEIQKMDDEIKKSVTKNYQALKKSLALPDCLDDLVHGKMKKDYL